jgi:hypothetical protein
MSIRYSLFSLFMFAFIAVGAHRANAGIPSPANSTVPPCFIACPAGDLSYTVVVRDIGGWPVVNSAVLLAFDACQAFQVCADCCAGVTINPQNSTAIRITDVNGAATFPLKLGGVCDGQRMIVRADGYLLSGGVRVASPDQDGDLLVDAEDALHLYALIGSQDAGADFDCDGTVTQADYDWMVNLHGGHSCSNVVSARAPSWGVLKLIYR